MPKGVEHKIALMGLFQGRSHVSSSVMPKGVEQLTATDRQGDVVAGVEFSDAERR